MFILGFSNFLIGQSKLTITPYFCQSWENISNFEHRIELYKDGKLISKEFYPINDFTVEDLKKGKYQLKYETIFYQTIEREINLTKNNKSIEICIDDYLKIKEKTFFEKLQINDTLEIWAYQTGCEYLDFGKIQLVKQRNNIEATLIQNDEIHRIVLGKNQFDLIEEIEHKIQLIKANEEDGFLRTSHYEIKLNGIDKVITKFGIPAIGFEKKINEIFKK